jgi:molybdate transport system regulatory protein
MTTMQPEVKVRVLEDQRAVYGDHEMRLLEAIGRQGTLSDGATALGLSYRSAWGKIKAMEAALGTRLVESTVGGRGGGSSRLTEPAQRLLAQYVRFRTALGEYAQKEFERCFYVEPGGHPQAPAKGPALGLRQPLAQEERV